MWSIQNYVTQEPKVNLNYNILNIVVNTELTTKITLNDYNYNILNIVVNTERKLIHQIAICNYNILNIVVNTELED